MGSETCPNRAELATDLLFCCESLRGASVKLTARIKLNSLHLVLLAVPVVVVFSCSSKAPTISPSSPDASATKDASAAKDASNSLVACSTGSAYPENTEFPFEEPESEDVDLPTCVPRCGQSAGEAQGFFSTKGIPSGTCEAEGARCGLGLGTICCSGMLGRVDSVRCTCQNRSWLCRTIGRGGGGCSTGGTPPCAETTDY